MKRGDLLAMEREYGRPRSFAEIVREEPSLQALQRAAVNATMTKLARRRAWKRRMKLAAFVAIVLLEMALVSAPMWIPLLRATNT